MKIGIVTYHRTNNYGAVMQALATRFVLEEMGHEAYYVDYWPDYHKDKYRIFSYSMFKRQGIISKIRTLRSLLRDYSQKKKRIDNFEKFFQMYIYPYCRPIDDKYDVVIYGSDQIWRKQSALGTYNPFYFGKNKINSLHHISYAASMGILPNNDADRAKVKELVSHLEKISVREEGLRQLLLSLGYKDVVLSLDPTLLLTSKEWDKYLPTEPYTGENYALFYNLDANAFDINKVKKFTNSKGLKLIVIYGYATTKETDTNITSAGPLEFIRLIKNADYVFSSSFHGLAFSIIFEKQFFASFMNNSERARNLLNLIGEPMRLLSPKSEVPQNMSPVNYGKVSEIMMLNKEKSIKYLIESFFDV